MENTNENLIMQQQSENMQYVHEDQSNDFNKRWFSVFTIYLGLIVISLILSYLYSRYINNEYVSCLFDTDRISTTVCTHILTIMVIYHAVSNKNYGSNMLDDIKDFYLSVPGVVLLLVLLVGCCGVNYECFLSKRK